MAREDLTTNYINEKQNTITSRSGKPTSISRKRKHEATVGEEEEEEKENLERQRSLSGKRQVSSAAAVRIVEGVVEPAVQSMNTGQHASSADERQALQDTPSKKKVKRGPARQPKNIEVSEENDMLDTIIVEAPGSRTSGRQRKQTWKLADAVEEQPEEQTPSRKRMSPVSLRKSKDAPSTSKKPAASVKKKASATLANGEVESTVVDIQPPPVLDLGSPQALASAALSVAQNGPAIVKATEQTAQQAQQPASAAITTTPRKRGRPPKNRGIDGSPSTAILGETPSKRVRLTNPLLGTEGITLSPSTPSRKKARLATDYARANVPSLSWQQYKDPEAQTQLDQVTGQKQQHQVPDLDTAQRELKSLLTKMPDVVASTLPRLRARIIRCLTGKAGLPLQGLDEEYAKVQTLVEQTVAAGEGNSMLVIGPRGSGKTAIVDSVLADLQAQHKDEFHVIRLNGFIHTDDKLALREIWRQLGREMQVDDEALLERSNYADTLASLLAVLSHPSEQQQQQQQEKSPAEDGVVEASNSTANGKVSRSVVFVIDEFDLFTTHARQTLLYNLFDVAQSRKAPIAVLGLTTRVDVAESLEKRVKSRFSHRHVFLARPRTFHAFQSIVLAALKGGIDGGAGRSSSGATHLENDENDDHDNESNGQKNSNYGTLQTVWANYATALLAPQTNTTAMLRLIYMTSRSVPAALTCFLASIAAFKDAASIPLDHGNSGHDADTDVSSSSPSSLCLPAMAIKALTPITSALQPTDSKLSLLPSLTEIELGLLIAAARLDIILNVDTCNFNMALDEYTTLAERARTQASASGVMVIGSGGGGASSSRGNKAQNINGGAAGGVSRLWSRTAALAAWERLEILELIMPLATAGYGAGAAGLADVGRAGRLMRCDVSLEEIKGCAEMGMGGGGGGWAGGMEWMGGTQGLKLGGGMIKWCREI